jgi:hypothetical protein
VICSAGRPERATRPEETGRLLRGGAGVWDRESGDRIKGCDGACIHAVGSLAGAMGWSITNVAAFPIFRRARSRVVGLVFQTTRVSVSLSFHLLCSIPTAIFNRECA